MAHSLLLEAISNKLTHFFLICFVLLSGELVPGPLQTCLIVILTKKNEFAKVTLVCCVVNTSFKPHNCSKKKSFKDYFGMGFIDHSSTDDNCTSWLLPLLVSYYLIDFFIIINLFFNLFIFLLEK